MRLKTRLQHLNLLFELKNHLCVLASACWNNACKHEGMRSFGLFSFTKYLFGWVSEHGASWCWAVRRCSSRSGIRLEMQTVDLSDSLPWCPKGTFNKWNSDSLHLVVKVSDLSIGLPDWLNDCFNLIIFASNHLILSLNLSFWHVFFNADRRLVQADTTGLKSLWWSVTSPTVAHLFNVVFLPWNYWEFH